MSFMILSDVSKQYLQEEDAVRGFRAAVENGQSRLALQILTDIVDAFMEIFQEAMDNPDNDLPEENALQEQVPVVQPVNPVLTTEVEAEPEKTKPAVKKEPKASE
jgi:hypothetical protein